MDLLEHEGKQLLSACGVPTPDGATVAEASEAAAIAAALESRVVVKAQVAAGKRGKSGAVRFAEGPAEAQRAAAELLGATVGGFPVERVLVERALPIARERYAAILNDPATKGPLLLFAASGGMEVEEPGGQVLRLPVDIRTGPTAPEVAELVAGTDVPEEQRPAIVDILLRIYGLYRDFDAELVEINPLAVTGDGGVVAADAKVSLDPGAVPRQAGRLPSGSADGRVATETALERTAGELGLPFIEFDGQVGVLSNGAGLTMTTVDAVHHYGGRPANFLEIGGDAYTKATAALRLVLDNPNVRSLLVNFCGAFARTDVMTEGVLNAIGELRPSVPVYFCIHGTGEAEAVAMVRERMAIEPYEHMDDAVRAAVAAAGQEGG